MQRRFLEFISAITVIALVGWGIVIYRLDPCLTPSLEGCQKVSFLALILFTLSLFFALLGIFTLLGFFLRRQLQGEFFYDQMGISLRQGLLLALTAILSMFLFLYGVLTWWSGFLLLAIILLIEVYFTARA